MPKLPKFLEVKDDDTEEEKKKKRFLLILFIILFFLLFAGIVVGIIFGVKSCGKPKPSSSTSESTTSQTTETTDSSIDDGYLTYALNGDNTTYRVTGCKPTHPVDIIVPSTYQDKPVVEIGDGAFYSVVDIESVTLPDTITKIGYQGFIDCSSLKTINLPESITYIGDEAFLWCDSLETITIPSEITVIKKESFSHCKSLTEVNFASSTNLLTIEYGAFSNCISLTSFDMPTSVTTIEVQAFINCNTSLYRTYDNAYYYGTTSNPYMYLIRAIDTSITSCNIHTDCLAIEYDAFYESSLTSIVIPNSVQYIYGGAFEDCEDLANIDLSDNLLYLGDDSLSYDGALTSVEVPASVTEFGIAVFNHSGIVTLVLNNEFEQLPEETLYSCYNLETITLPSSLKIITSDDFGGLSKLDTIHFKGAKEAWNAIDKEDGWSNDAKKPLTIHCTDGDIVIND